MVLLALMQANSAVLDVEANCGAVDDAARTAAAAGARVLLTPELFPVGYAPLRVRAELDPARLPAIRRTLADIARRNGIALVYSLPAVTADGRWQITSTLVDQRGCRAAELRQGAPVRRGGAQGLQPCHRTSRRRGLPRDQDVHGDLLRRRISRRPCVPPQSAAPNCSWFPRPCRRGSIPSRRSCCARGRWRAS